VFILAAVHVDMNIMKYINVENTEHFGHVFGKMSGEEIWKSLAIICALDYMSNGS